MEWSIDLVEIMELGDDLVAKVDQVDDVAVHTLQLLVDQVDQKKRGPQKAPGRLSRI